METSAAAILRTGYPGDDDDLLALEREVKWDAFSLSGFEKNGSL